MLPSAPPMTITAPLVALSSSVAAVWNCRALDIVVPSASFFGRQIKAGYYQKLDKALLPNHGNMDPEILAKLAETDPAVVIANHASGLFELADTGTLFMDEVSEMPLDVQVKLLRVLETSTFRRLGGNRDISVDVRFVFASNKNLLECVNRGEFRDDLYHRINLLLVNIPPLRERKEDVMPLAWFFLKSSNAAPLGGWEFSPDAVASLCAYDWPGNVRELRNTIRRACILAPESIITADLFPFSPPRPTPTPLPAVISPVTAATATTAASAEPLWVMEKAHIRQVLELVEGNKSKAARILEIDRKTLYTKLERYGLE